MRFFEPIRNFYGRFERPISSFSLILGFVFDALTLKRVDTLFENVWILGHLLIIGTFIALIHIQESGAGDEADPSKKHFWYVNILQFFIGGILSAYLVFYFRSADIFSTWPFILLLIIAFLANESLKRHYVRFSFQISLFFLSIFSFLIFLLPVLLHQIGDGIFLLSGFLSLIFIVLFIAALFKLVKERFTENKKLIWILVGAIYVGVNLLYFTNLIPPIPLSLKDAGIYHSVRKNAEGNYDVAYQDHGWLGYFQLYPDFGLVAGSPVYAFSAIFSPKDLNLTIIHEWQHYYDEVGSRWLTESTIRLSVIGGRDGGFRTYSLRSNLAPGKWRVNIKTEQGQTIGQLRLNITPTAAEPALSALVK